MQVESGVVGTAAILAHLGKRAAIAVRGHKETDPRRKIDPVGLDMSDIRRRIDDHMHPTIAPPEDEDVIYKTTEQAHRFIKESYQKVAGRDVDNQDVLDTWTWAILTDPTAADRLITELLNERRIHVDQKLARS